MKSIAKLTLFLIAYFAQLHINAQVTYNFTTAATASGTVANITASAVTPGNSTITTINGAGNPASTGYTGATGTGNANFIAKTTAFALTTSSYAQITLTPATNYAISLSGLRWGNFSLNAVGAVASGPTTLSVYASTNNFSTSTLLATTSVTPNATAWNLINPSFTTFTAPTGTVITIRIYGSGGTGTIPTGTAITSANWRIDDIAVTATAQTGTIGQIPKYTGPATFTNSIITESSTGNIGIGTTTPVQKLDVNGTIKTTGLQITTGAALNKVLTSDASGNATWQIPAAGGTNFWTASGNDILNNNTGNVIVSTNISSPGTGLASEKFGAGASTGNAANAIAIGNTATANGNGAIAIGKSSSSTFTGSVVLGNNLTVPGDYAVGIGANINSVGSIGMGLNLNGGSINIGSNNSAGVNHTSILIGSGLIPLGQNELRIGSGNAGWWPTELYLSGATSNALASVYGDQSYHAISGTGTNVAGQGIKFRAGKSTGNAKGGEISFHTAAPGVAGTTENAGLERMRIDAFGNVGIGNATPAIKLDVSGIVGLAPNTFTGGGSLLFGSTNGGLNNPGAFISGEKTGIWGNRMDFYARDAAGAITKNVMSVTGEGPGMVGIGTTTPTDKLHIEGSFRLVNGSQAVGKVLTSDANGVATWATPSGGGSGSGWGLSGNALSDASSFIGTTNDFDLVFKRNGITSGSINNSLGNSSFGVNTLKENTTGYSNTAMGYLAGKSNTTGNYNSFFGSNAGALTTTGIQNNFIGANAGAVNTTGSFNSFNGVGAGTANTTGGLNSFVGAYAGAANTTGGYNNFIGYLAGSGNTTGTYNNFIGVQTGNANVTGNHNNFYGFQAGLNNTTGTANNFMGNFSGQANTTGNYNNFIGYFSGNSNTTGNFNTFYGYRSGNEVTTASTNTIIGYNTGLGIVTGDNNTIIGANVTGLAPTLNNAIILADGQGNQRIFVNNEGKVGLGTNTPSEKLDVNGNIYTNGKLFIGTNGFTGTQLGTHALAVNGSAIFTKAVVKLTGDWPDFVFNTNYDLMPLTELEKFIRQNNHLPEFISAKQINENGIDLGANQTLLVKKIEELTLYAIEADKKITEQQMQIKTLSNQQKQIQFLTEELRKLKKLVDQKKD